MICKKCDHSVFRIAIISTGKAGYTCKKCGDEQ